MSATIAAPRRTAVYVANADSRDITVLALDGASGALIEVERFGTGGAVMPLAASPDRRVLYASIRSEPYRVLSLAIDAASGRLAEIGSAPLPASSCWISTDRSGRFLLSASYGSSLVAVSPIDADGIVGAAQQVVATEANAHSIRADPSSNRFAFAACLGGGVVRQLRFDPVGGALGDNDPPAWRARAGAGPRHFTFHPPLPIVYLLNELDASLDVIVFDRGARPARRGAANRDAAAARIRRRRALGRRAEAHARRRASSTPASVARARSRRSPSTRRAGC